VGTKRGKLQITSCQKNGRRVWRVNVPVSLAGRRMRRFFDFEREAVSWADDFQDSLKKYGTKGLAVDGKTVNDVLSRFWALKGLVGPHAQTARSVLASCPSGF
jgi:hypothetical protein